jgi:dihydrofolate synthase / folylpolyglutamate synthase
VEYSQICKYLDDCLIFGIKPGLIRIKKILELLDNPQKKVGFIHVVGTNGKTSTTKITSEILRYNGVRAGYYISPHINNYTERIGINGKDISKKKFSGVFNRIYPYIKKVNKMNLDGPLTQFEIISAMAFKLAEDENLEVMVLEAGMGGRWDATNVVDAKVVGLTGVSLEHTDYLGNTIKKISSEKVEVIKDNTLVAAASRNKKVIEVLNKKVISTGSSLFLYGEDFCILKKVNLVLKGWLLDIKGIKSIYKNLTLPLLGRYQPLNLSLSIALAELYMDTKKKKLSNEKLKESISLIKITGRFEIIRKEPLVIADTGHNPEGINNLVRSMNDYFKNRKKIIIFAVLRDKDYERMIEKIISISDILILTSSRSNRSLGAVKLEEAVRYKIKSLTGIRKCPDRIYSIDNVEDSIKFALKISNINDIICITGSITNLENIVK